MPIADQTPTVAAIRAQFPTPLGDQHAACLIALAKALGAQLLRKDSGSHITLPNGINVSQDILVFNHGQDCFDVLGDAEGAAIPSWNPKGAIAGEYIDVSEAPVPRPTPQPIPDDLVAAIMDLRTRVAKLEAWTRGV